MSSQQKKKGDQKPKPPSPAPTPGKKNSGKLPVPLLSAGGLVVVFFLVSCLCLTLGSGNGSSGGNSGVFDVFASGVGGAPAQGGGGLVPMMSSISMSLLVCTFFICIVVVVVRKAKERQLDGELEALMKELEAIEASAQTGNATAKKPAQYDEISGYTIPGIKPPTAEELKVSKILGAPPIPTSCSTVKQQCDKNPLCTHYEVWKPVNLEPGGILQQMKPEFEAMFGKDYGKPAKPRCVMKLGPVFPDQCKNFSTPPSMNGVNYQCGGGLSAYSTAYVHPRMYAMAKKQGVQLSKWDIIKNRDVLVEMSKPKAQPTWKKVLSAFELAAIILLPLSGVLTAVGGAVAAASSALGIVSGGAELGLTGYGIASDIKQGKASAKLAIESQKLGIPIDNYSEIYDELASFMVEVGTPGQPMGYCSNDPNERDLRADFRRVNSIYGKPCAPFNCAAEQFGRIVNYRNAPEYKCKGTDYAASPALLSGS